MRGFLASTLLGVVLLTSACTTASAHVAAPPAEKHGPPVTLVSAGVPEAAQASPVDPQLVSGINGPGFDLLRKREANPQRGGQTVISPLSVHAALSMLENGASGRTLTETRRVLHVSGLPEPQANVAYANLLSGLPSSGAATLSVADSLWVDDDYPIEPSFAAADQRYFGAELHSLDLATERAMTEINEWVSRATRGLIPTVLDKPLPRQAALCLINAAYFKGDWVSPFTKSATGEQPFHAPQGGVMADLMWNTDTIRYVRTTDYQAAELPYKGGRYGMLVVLPSTSSSLDSLVGSLTPQSFSAMRGSLRSQDVELAIPKTELRWDGSLGGDLEALGMSSAFSANTAEFKRVSALPRLYVDDVIHKTYLRVDERGTEAAAVTVVKDFNGYMEGAAGTPPLMVVDRPYLMAIVDRQTGTILFLAAVRDPRPVQ